MSKNYFVYILTNRYSTVLYVGVTNNLIRRVWEHKRCLVKGFTSKYRLTKLIYYEVFTDIKEAIQREKYIKGKKRNYKLQLITSVNKEFRDLYGELL